MKAYKTPAFVVSIKGTSVLRAVGTFLLLLFLVFSVSGLLTSLNPEYRPKSSSVNTTASYIDGKFLYQLFGWENHAFFQSHPVSEETIKLSSIVFKMSTNVNLDDPRSLLGRELPGFSLYDGKILVAGEGTNYTNLPIESAPPQEILKAGKEAPLQNIEPPEHQITNTKKPVLTTGEKKVLYIYFSHTREAFLPYLKGVTDPNNAHHSQINVTKIGDRLAEKLEDFGIGTTVDKTDIMKNLNEKGWDYGRAYDESRNVVEASITNNRDLTYLIDIHRDSRRKKDTTKVINGKSYAKVAFVIGAENPNYEENLKLANELHQKFEEKFSGLSRGIIEKKGAHTNGKFNQDLSENALLIEFGGVDNTFEELNRTADVFAQFFSEIYWDAEQVTVPIK